MTSGIASYSETAELRTNLYSSYMNCAGGDTQKQNTVNRVHDAGNIRPLSTLYIISCHNCGTCSVSICRHMDATLTGRYLSHARI